MPPISSVLGCLGFSCLMVLASPVMADAVDVPLPAAAMHALDGMAPAGRWAARLTVLRNGYDRRFDDTGKLVDLDKAYDGVDLAAYGLAGIFRLDTDVVTEFTELMLGYGVTENLTLGAIIPYVRTTRRVRWSVDGGIGTNGLQAVLTGPLGYRSLKTTSTVGFGDPTVGALWRFHKTARDSAILGLGVRFGLARADDPDNLMDIPPGDGSTDLRARLEYFRDLGSGVDLRLMGEYLAQLPDQVRMRPGNPLTTVRSERLKRDLGDYWETDLELGKRVGDWRFAATWHHFQATADRYTSRIGTDTGFLSENTRTFADQYRLSVTWSGIGAWQAGRLPLPLIVKLEMQDAFRGRNFVDVRDIYLRVSTFF